MHCAMYAKHVLGIVGRAINILGDNMCTGGAKRGWVLYFGVIIHSLLCDIL